jgi:hypothetical protein
MADSLRDGDCQVRRRFVEGIPFLRRISTRSMSALPRKADISRVRLDVRFVAGSGHRAARSIVTEDGGWRLTEPKFALQLSRRWTTRQPAKP